MRHYSLLPSVWSSRPRPQSRMDTIRRAGPCLCRVIAIAEVALGLHAVLLFELQTLGASGPEADHHPACIGTERVPETCLAKTICLNMSSCKAYGVRRIKSGSWRRAGVMAVPPPARQPQLGKAPMHGKSR